MCTNHTQATSGGGATAGFSATSGKKIFSYRHSARDSSGPARRRDSGTDWRR